MLYALNNNVYLCKYILASIVPNTINIPFPGYNSQAVAEYKMQLLRRKISTNTYNNTPKYIIMVKKHNKTNKPLISIINSAMDQLISPSSELIYPAWILATQPPL